MSSHPLPGPDQTSPGFHHEALLYRSEAELLGGLLPFITAGLDEGDAVMAVVAPAMIRLLVAELGEASERVEFVDVVDLGLNPARMMPPWLRFLDRNAGSGRSTRGIGGLVMTDRRPVEVVETQFQEALLNVAVDPRTPFRLLCPYDVRQLTPGLLEDVSRSHMVLVEAERRRPSAGYAGRAQAELIFGTDLPQLLGRPDQLYFNRAGLQRIIPFVAARAHFAGVAEEQAGALAVAVHQLALSSLSRGAAGGVVRVWLQHQSFVCEVHDHTRTEDPLLGRQQSSTGDRSGVWFANQVCDLVQLRSNRSGTTVRLHHWT
jgi:hypothetical protein